MITRGRILSLIAVGTMCSFVSACRSERKPEVPSNPTAQDPIAASSEAPSESAPITWNDVASSYGRVVDYTCVYEKVELAISKGEQQNIRFSFRKPLDVRLDWLDASGNVDQTAIYRQGFNDGKALARQSGLLGTLAGKLRLDPNEPMALSDSSHPITEVGIGKIIDRAQHDAANPGVASHFIAEALDGRPTYKLELTASGNDSVGGLVAARKAIIWIDRELKLPVKMELYDAANGLLERHQFKQLRLNQKLTDKTFGL